MGFSIPANSRSSDALELHSARVGPHTSIWERGRQHKHVVLPPLVRENDALNDLHKLLHVPLKLPLTRLELVRTRRNIRPRPDRRLSDVPRGERKQVTRDGHLLLKDIQLIPVILSLGLAFRGDAAGDHDVRARDAECVRRLDVGRVLAREQRPRVNGLALAEHKGRPLARRLLGREPLQRRARRRRGQLDVHADQLALGGARGDRDVHGRAEGLGAVFDGPLGVGRVHLDRGHGHVAAVEDDLLAGLVGLRLELQSHQAAERLVLEVDLQVGRCVPGPPCVIVGRRGGIAGRHAGFVEEANLDSSSGGDGDGELRWRLGRAARLRREGARNELGPLQ